MVSMHLALEVHLNGRSIQAYLLGDVVVFCFLSGETQYSQSAWHHWHLWHLKSQPGMILPSTKICGTVWAAKMKMFGVWIKLDSLQRMDPTLGLSCFIMKGSSIHQLENICWDRRQSCQLIPSQSFIPTSICWQQTAPHLELSHPFQSVHEFQLIRAMIGFHHLRMKQRNGKYMVFPTCATPFPISCLEVHDTVRLQNHAGFGAKWTPWPQRLEHRFSHAENNMKSWTFRFPFSFSECPRLRKHYNLSEQTRSLPSKRSISWQKSSWDPSCFQLSRHASAYYDMLWHETSRNQLPWIAWLRGPKSVTPNQGCSVFHANLVLLDCILNLILVNLRHVLPTLEMLEQNVANSYWCFVSFGENLLLSIHHTNIVANGEDSGKLVLGFGLTMLGAQQNVAPIRDANAAAVEAGRWTILWWGLYPPKGPKGLVLLHECRSFFLHWLTQNCSQEERVVSHNIRPGQLCWI